MNKYLLSQVNTKDEWLEKLIAAKQNFDRKEFPFSEHDEIFTLEDIIQVAYTDEVFDTDEDFEYEIQCSLDLKNRLDIYEIENEHIHITVRRDMSYEDMIENLSASFDSWVSFQNGVDVDLATELIFDYLANKDMTDTIVEYKDNDIDIIFKNKKSSKG